MADRWVWAGAVLRRAGIPDRPHHRLALAAACPPLSDIDAAAGVVARLPEFREPTTDLAYLAQALTHAGHAGVMGRVMTWLADPDLRDTALAEQVPGTVGQLLADPNPKGATPHMSKITDAVAEARRALSTLDSILGDIEAAEAALTGDSPVHHLVDEIRALLDLGGTRAPAAADLPIGPGTPPGVPAPVSGQPATEATAAAAGQVGSAPGETPGELPEGLTIHPAGS